MMTSGFETPRELYDKQEKHKPYTNLINLLVNLLLKFNGLVLECCIEYDYINIGIICENLLHVAKESIHLSLVNSSTLTKNQLINNNTILIHNHSS